MKSNIIIIFYLLLNIFVIVTSSSNDTRILDYQYNNKIYSIEENGNNYKVIMKEIIYCITTPCNPPVIDTISIKDKEDKIALKDLFDELFKNSEAKVKGVIDKMLTPTQIKIISDVLEKNKILIKLEYEIINGLSQHNQKYNKRGYYYEVEKDGGVTYTIAMGQKPSAGYSIDVQKVKIKDKKVIVYAYEKEPGRYEGVDTVLTYPIAQIKLTRLPSEITILNYETGKEFPCLME